MPAQPLSDWLVIEPIGQVTVVRFKIARHLKEETVEMIAEQLLNLVKHRDKPQLLLDFHEVERLYSIMLGKIIALHRKVQAAGGRLVLCQLRPTVYEAFEILRLPQVLHICKTEDEALQSFS